MALNYPHIKVDIYEGDKPYPVVSHIFYGETIKEAERYYRAHLHTDSFLRGAINKGEWSGIPLVVDVKMYG